MSLLMDALKKAEEAKRRSEAAAKDAPQESPPAVFVELGIGLGELGGALARAGCVPPGPCAR